MILKEWTHAGMTCALRHGAFDAPCGYVAIPDGHPIRRIDRREVYGAFSVHGGISYYNPIRSDPRNRLWIGFDMAHAWDFDPLDYSKCIRTDEECIAETNRLAEQLAKTGGE